MKASLKQVLQEFTDWKTTSFLWIKQPAPSFSCNNYLSHSTLSFNYKRSDFIFMKIKILDLASSQFPSPAVVIRQRGFLPSSHQVSDPAA